MSKIFLKNLFVKKASARVQGGPRSPPDPPENYECIRKLFHFSIIFIAIALPIGLACQRTGPGPDRLGLKCYLAWGERGWWVRGRAKGPRPDPLGFRPFRPGLGGGVVGPRGLGRAGLGLAWGGGPGWWVGVGGTFVA